MRLGLAAAALALALGGCVKPPAKVAAPPAPIELQILALNDFHGNLEPPRSPIERVEANGTKRRELLGGAAYVAATLAQLRAGQSHSVTLAAGDMIGASPLTSAYFLDEPSIIAMNMMGLEYAAVGNHEFDKGSAELLRMQNGGCAKFTSRTPCQVDRFGGANFGFLAANVIRADGSTLFPATAIKNLGPLQVGIIGMTLKGTGTLVTPSGVAGLRFTDEAATANALIPQLKAAGADLIVLALHQGGRSTGVYNVTGCPALSGDILPILDALDPGISVVVSGHTHEAYACERPARDGSRRLLTSAGRYGYFVTDIRLSVDPGSGDLLGVRASNVPVTSTVMLDSHVQALVDRYAKAAAPAAARAIGRLAGPAMHSDFDDESAAANLVADAQFAFSRDPARGGSQFALMNSSGVRTDLVPNAQGNVSYGQIFEMQPFGNGLVVMTLTGAQIGAVLEQQFQDDSYEAGARPELLIPSDGLRFDYDLARPEGQRIVRITLLGKPLDPAANYRVTVNNFLASGGDGFSALTEGKDVVDAGPDLDALEAWLKPGRAVPKLDRTRNVTAR
ncbi:MAG TPA: bifunctional metallophosphatase/5'-nucleotidase [Sphingomicrobium sp.]